MYNRGLGILAHVSSLPGSLGTGCFDAEARRFVDWLARAGVKYWQVLGFNPPDFAGSPYAPVSCFAGNPLFIDLAPFFSEPELKSFGLDIKGNRIDFEKLFAAKTKAFAELYRRGYDKTKLARFIKDNKYWVESFAAFMAARAKSGTAEATLEYHIFIQMIFFEQWDELKNYANQKGVQVIGDVPIYPCMDSADVFAHKEQFDFTDGKPTGVSGVPPDYFNAEGQYWGNPLYNFKQMTRDKFKWWCERIKLLSKMFDLIRIDHFRAFDSYWKIPVGAKSAREGEWCKGPGIKAFNAMLTAVPGLRLILEDLGDITPSVRKLRDLTGYPGMLVFQFGFNGDNDNEHLPHNYPTNCVAYLGTHDNDTFVGFLKNADPTTKKNVDDYLDTNMLSAQDTTRVAIEKLLSSNADIVVLSVQDLLFQGSESRMNTPGSTRGNWAYRIAQGGLTDELATYVKMIAGRSGR